MPSCSVEHPADYSHGHHDGQHAEERSEGHAHPTKERLDVRREVHGQQGEHAQAKLIGPTSTVINPLAGSGFPCGDNRPGTPVHGGMDILTLTSSPITTALILGGAWGAIVGIASHVYELIADWRAQRDYDRHIGWKP